MTNWKDWKRTCVWMWPRRQWRPLTKANVDTRCCNQCGRSVVVSLTLITWSRATIITFIITMYSRHKHSRHRYRWRCRPTSSYTTPLPQQRLRPPPAGVAWPCPISEWNQRAFPARRPLSCWIQRWSVAGSAARASRPAVDTNRPIWWCSSRAPSTLWCRSHPPPCGIIHNLIFRRATFHFSR